MSFKVEAFQNRYLSPGSRRVDGILSISAAAGVGASSLGRPLVIGFILDTSGSMSGDRIDGVKQAIATAIAMLDESTQFFVVAFSAMAEEVVSLRPATPENKREAVLRLHKVRAVGGTAMSTGLRKARELFEREPNAIRQAVFLTDGKNESEHASEVNAELAQCRGQFDCDCWGVGTDWRVGEVQQIASALLGKASLIPDAKGIEAAFRAAMTKASSKAIKDVRLRLWSPQGARLVFFKQVNPQIEDLTSRARPLSPQVQEYFTGAWAAGETREYHVQVEVPASQVGAEMLVVRPSVAYFSLSPGGAWIETEEKPPEGRLFASWTSEETLSSRIDDHVAHYTGQDELAHAIEDGLASQERGDTAAATQLLGKAVKLAHAAGDTPMTQRLAKIVDVLDASQGTVRLKSAVKREAAMELQLESRTTKRVSRKSADPGPTS